MAPISVNYFLSAAYLVDARIMTELSHCIRDSITDIHSTMFSLQVMQFPVTAVFISHTQ